MHNTRLDITHKKLIRDMIITGMINNIKAKKNNKRIKENNCLYNNIFTLIDCSKQNRSTGTNKKVR